MRGPPKIEPLTERARDLRASQTPSESLLWSKLRGRRLHGRRFRRQNPIGPFIVDFVCEEARLIIELDGGQHSDQQPYDKARTDFLESKGYRVLRFWHHEVMKNLHGIEQTILAAVSLTLPPALPAGPSLSRIAGEGL
jgi:adenine-specific DNA-methyltransferase